MPIDPIHRSIDEQERRRARAQAEAEANRRRKEEKRRRKQEKAEKKPKSTEKPTPITPPPNPRHLLLHKLGLTPDKDDPLTIRSAFRRLALKLHPDKNPSPAAEELFKAIVNAYERLLA